MSGHRRKSGGGGNSMSRPTSSAAAVSKAQREEAVPSWMEGKEKSQYTVWIGSIGDLDDDEIKALFEDATKDAVVEITVKDGPRGRFGFLTFSRAATVDRLLEDGQLDYGDYTIICAPHYTKPNEFRAKQETLLKSLDSESGQAKQIEFSESREGGRVGEAVRLGSTVTSFIKITFYGSSTTFYRTECFGSSPEFKIDWRNVRTKKDEQKWRKAGPNWVLPLMVGDTHVVKVTFQQNPQTQRFGIFRTLLVFHFAGFTKAYKHEITVANSKEMEMLKPSSEYVGRGERDQEIDRVVVPAFPPSRANKFHIQTLAEAEYTDGLPVYEIPNDLQKSVDMRDRYSKQHAWQTRDKYVERMHDLLWTEEAQQKKLIRQYDRFNVAISPVDSYVVNDQVKYAKDQDLSRITIPNLAEKRPSVLAGDIIYAWLPGSSDVEFEGYVYRVEKDFLLVQFCEDFHDRFGSNTLFNIRFAFSRLSFRQMHRAIDVALLDVVWPESYDYSLIPAVSRSSIKYSDDLVAKNLEQATAVAAIVNKSPAQRNVPYLIFGPFGTGKTRTLVEAIAQVLVHHPKARLLICAPANSAVDAIVEALSSKLDKTKLFRLYAAQRAIGTVPAKLQQFGRYDFEKEAWAVPRLEELMQFTVIATTTMSAATLYAVGMANSFTHIFIDEAAQLMEAEALIPLSLANRLSVVVLSGDDRQLGPQVQSVSVRNLGLTRSLMERLMGYHQFKDAGTKTHVTLVKNYRSHSELLKISNIFYDVALESMAPIANVSSLLNWRRLPNKTYPVLFCGVEGQDQREGDSPSFFNSIEAVAIGDLVASLVEDKNLRQTEVGIVSPYYKQVQKIRMVLREKNLRDVKVGSVAEFQGKEYKALFISTVRASRHWFEHDKKYGLGLLKDQRALNTALSRVTSLLVVVGDPYVLSMDDYWQKIMTICRDNKAYIGPTIGAKYLQEREAEDIPPVEEKEVEEPIVPATKTPLAPPPSIAASIAEDIANMSKFEFDSDVDSDEDQPPAPAPAPSKTAASKPSKPAATPVLPTAATQVAASAPATSPLASSAASAPSAASALNKSTTMSELAENSVVISRQEKPIFKSVGPIGREVGNLGREDPIASPKLTDLPATSGGLSFAASGAREFVPQPMQNAVPAAVANAFANGGGMMPQFGTPMGAPVGLGASPFGLSPWGYMFNGAGDAMMNFGVPMQAYPSYPMPTSLPQQNMAQASSAPSAAVPKSANAPPAGPTAQTGNVNPITSWQPLYTHNGNALVLFDSSMSTRLPYQVIEYADSLVVEVCTFGLAISRLNAQYSSLFIGLAPDETPRIAANPVTTFKFGQGALLFQATTDFDERIEASPAKGTLTVRFKKTGKK